VTGVDLADPIPARTADRAPRPPAQGETVEVVAPGYEVRTRHLPAAQCHGDWPLDAAVRVARTLGPPGERLLWLDTETTGLAGGTGTYVFLVGLARLDGEVVTVRQHFLAGLRDERAMLEGLAAELRDADGLVTFNGTRFDLPLLATRYLLARVGRGPTPSAHLDLMAVARRLWYRPLGGFSLATVERAVLGVRRQGDLPGWAIPARYVEYLRTGHRAGLEPVFTHNLQDLLSLMALHGLAGALVTDGTGTIRFGGAGIVRAGGAGTVRAATGGSAAVAVPVDFWGLGRLREGRGDAAGAVACYREALRVEQDPALRRRTACALARLYRRAGALEALHALWQREATLGILPRWLCLERLAVFWEWSGRDLRRALRCAEGAIAAAGEADAHGDAPLLERLHRRRERLARKVSGIGRQPPLEWRAQEAPRACASSGPVSSGARSACRSS